LEKKLVYVHYFHRSRSLKRIFEKMNDNTPQAPIEDSFAQSQSTSGYVKDKIKAHTAEKVDKSASALSRARKEARKTLAKIVKKAASISQLLTERDQQQNLRVIRDAKKATHRIWDGEQKKLIEVPDHKTRLAATALDLAYREGRPRERSENVHVHATTEDFKLMLDRIRQSKGAQRRLPAELVKTLENGVKAQDVVTDDAQNRESESDSMTRDTSDSK
jgi:hypothetical protein